MKYDASDKVQLTLALIVASAWYDNHNGYIVRRACENLGAKWVREALSECDGIHLPDDWNPLKENNQ